MPLGYSKGLSYVNSLIPLNNISRTVNNISSIINSQYKE
jgi:hypothetical protein